MQCHRCQQENPSGQRHCGECGARLPPRPASDSATGRRARRSEILARAQAGERTPAETGPARDRDLRLFDEFPAMIWRAGTDTTCDYFNHAWLAFTGRALEEELGNGWAEGVHPEDRELCVQAYLAAFHARVPFVLQYRLRRHDGAFRWILDHGRPYDDVEGQFAGYLGGCYDITEQMQAAAMAARLEGVVLTAREIAHHLNNDLQGPTILLESLQNDPYLPPAVQALMHVGATGLASAVTHLQQLQRVVRVETRPTPLGPALDLARSTAEERD